MFTRYRSVFLETTVLFLFILVYCEYFHNYLVLNQCLWPTLKSEIENTDFNQGKTDEDPLQILVIADIHLLGPRRGLWLDRVISDWQMSKTFQMLVSLLLPNIIFILGDTMDEGLHLTAEEFDEHIRRFNALFKVPAETRVYTVVGNHDIGFHHEISTRNNDRFIGAFKSPPIQLITEKGNHFVLVNSMAMEGDNCFLCKPAMEELSRIEKILNCAKGSSDGYCEHIDQNEKLHSYSKPILIQHFPLYRRSDLECNDSDAATLPTKAENFKESWDCLSKNATLQLLRQVEPRLSLSGHTHHGCTKKLPIGDGLEITIPSFNWKNKNNPTVGLGVFTPNNYSFVRCPIPKQSTAIALYTIGISLILLKILNRFIETRRRKKSKYILSK